MRILIIGSSGMLGFALHRVLQDAGWDVTGTIRGSPPTSGWCGGLKYLAGANIEDLPSVMRAIEQVQPAVVINAAGITKPESVDWNSQKLLLVNAMFPRWLDSAAARVGFHLIHFSSDGVFSGMAGNYDEHQHPDATDIYGISKYLGEPVGNRSLVLRTSVVGRSVGDGRSLLDWLLCQRGTITGFRRALFSGLPANEIGSILSEKILRREPLLTGLYNLSSVRISKFDLLELLRTEWGIQDLAIRPDDEIVIDRSLDSRLIRAATGYCPPDWPALVHSMHEFYAGLDRRYGAA